VLADNLLAIQVMNLHHTSLTLSNHSRHAWLKYSQTARIKGKGRGVLASRALRRGELVCEYHGDLINAEEGFAREAVYAVSWIFLFLSAHWKLLFVIFQKDTREIPCCLFWITFRTVKYWFDAYLSRWCLTLYRYVRVRSNNFNRYDWLIHALKQSIFDLFCQYWRDVFTAHGSANQSLSSWQSSAEDHSRWRRAASLPYREASLLSFNLLNISKQYHSPVRTSLKG